MYFRTRADDTNVTILGKPVSVPTTGKFEGSDGKWSTFFINVGDDGSGTKGQNFRVLPSTSSPITLIPKKSDWCDQSCAQKRGVEIFNANPSLGFDTSASRGWKESGRYGIPVPDWWTGTNSRDTTWGADTVGTGSSSKDSDMLSEQWVVLSDIRDFFMGSFGLAAGSISPSSGVSKPPFLTNLADANWSTSVSYGYTAGANYRNNGNGVPGSLVLGGFDRSRFGLQSISIAMPSRSDNSLNVGVQSITSTRDTLNAAVKFRAVIDSTLPFLYLPEAICEKFASTFQLKWDSSSQLYTVNETAHKHNLDQNENITFTISSDPNGSNDYTAIVLPYAAFDLQTSFPGVKAVNYFPIRKSKDKFVLGRTFLQEAYIIVDYERSTFTIAPANFSDPLPDTNIQPIYSKSDEQLLGPPTNSSTGHDSKDGENGQGGGKGGLAAGAIAGIVVGILLLFLLGVAGFFFWRKRRAPKEQHDKVSEIAEIDTMYVPEVKQVGMLELDSSQQAKHPGDYYSNNRDNKDVIPFPAISEMESPPAAPAELYSPPPSSTPAGSDGKASDYFTRPRRRGATRESPGTNTPGTPGVAAIHELAGDDGQFQVAGMHFERVESPPPGTRSHSRGPSDTNIDQIISEQPSPPEATETTSPTTERRPSHARGASDTTVQSNVSQPTPEEMESWALGGKEDPRRPVSE